MYFVEGNTNHKSKSSYINCSISITDVSIGTTYLYQTPDYTDNKLVFDDIFRIVKQYSPKELVVFGEKLSFTFETLTQYLDTTKLYCYNKLDNFHKKVLDVNYQNESIRKIFKQTGLLTPIEFVDLERNQYLLVCYVFLITFLFEHNERIIQKLCKPLVLEQTDSLVLTNNTLQLLNVFDPNAKSKHSSLLNFLNNCITHSGKRYFKECLLSPITDVAKLNERYDNVNKMLHNNNYSNVRNALKNVFDVERLVRRVVLQKINPSEFLNIHLSIKCLDVPPESNYGDFYYSPKSHLTDICVFIENHLKLDEIGKYNINNIRDSFFQQGVYPELDKIQIKLNQNILSFQSLCDELNATNPKNDKIFKVDCNDRDGYHLLITQKRWKEIEKKVKELNKNLHVKPVSSASKQYKVFVHNTEEINDEIRSLSESLKTEIMNHFTNFCIEFYEKFEDVFPLIINHIKVTDYYANAAYLAQKYNYKQPIIGTAGTNAYIKAKNMRHPIIEIIQNDIPYVPNDIELGLQTNGMLLYGHNGSGKSSFMKSIGLNLILAQAGLFVACESFEFYPYRQIFTRIPGGDNLFKGQSSFTNEISELRNILKKADENSLIIGDEPCSSTESISATSIVTACIIQLTNKKASYIFASHLHEVADMDIIKDLQKSQKLSIKHLSVSVENKKLIFDRTMQYGSGDTLYGLEVCRSLDLDPSFLELANEIRNKILDNALVHYKKSRYNNSLLVDICGVCKQQKAVETHHIFEQKDADEHGFIDTGKHVFHKNKKFNLIGICEQCHQGIHNTNTNTKEIATTKGRVLTTDGIELR
jgi:DNA mismatch repair protein MutS